MGTAGPNAKSAGEAAPANRSILSISSRLWVPCADALPTRLGGRLRASYTAGRWYDGTVAPDGSGTYDIAVNPAISIPIGRGPEGIVYVPPGSSLFPVPSILVAEYGSGEVASYEIDGNGDPMPATRRSFVTDLTNAEGALIDPISGDFLFSTFGAGNQLIRVSAVAQPPIPEPGTYALLALGLAFLAIAARRRLNPTQRRRGR